VTEKMWVREWSLITPRTGLCMEIITGGISVLLIDLPLSLLGHSSRLAVLHFSLAKKSTSRVINLHYSVYVCVRELYGCVRLSSTRFPMLLNNSATLLSALAILDEMLALQEKLEQKKQEAEVRRHRRRSEREKMLLYYVLSNLISSYRKKKRSNCQK